MYYFDVTDERGHHHHLPLWKFPQIVAQEIEHKKTEIEQLKRTMYAEETAKIQAAQAAQQQQIAEVAALDTPFDLTTPAGIEG
jgi:ABC-type Zn2+ transport system substrate-binding protein/surface adhesin